MAKLSKREQVFNVKQCAETHKLRGYYKLQRERVVLKADEKPQHGVSQQMPPRG